MVGKGVPSQELGLGLPELEWEALVRGGGPEELPKYGVLPELWEHHWDGGEGGMEGIGFGSQATKSCT